MQTLNLGITTQGDDKDKPPAVHLTATFEDKSAAIEFHARLAALCQEANLYKPKVIEAQSNSVSLRRAPWSRRLGWMTGT